VTAIGKTRIIRLEASDLIKNPTNQMPSAPHSACDHSCRTVSNWNTTSAPKLDQVWIHVRLVGAQAVQNNFFRLKPKTLLEDGYRRAVRYVLIAVENVLELPWKSKVWLHCILQQNVDKSDYCDRELEIVWFAGDLSFSGQVGRNVELNC
jgi:NADH:ubiquinone oxidoreductase subunit